MPNTVEAAPARDLRVKEDLEAKLDRLEQEFPDKVARFPAGSFLYHYSRTLRRLLRDSKLDPRKSNNDGAFYFSDVPVQYTNCKVEIQNDLVMFRFNELSDEEYHRLDQLGDGNFWIGGMRLGFDGRIFRTADPFVEVKDRKFALEVVVFPSSLNKLRRVSVFDR